MLSGPCALRLGRCCTPSDWKYFWSRCESLPLKGSPLSLCRYRGSPCRANTSEKACMLSSAPVPLTLKTSGYCVRPSMMTRMCLPSLGVGPQWSQKTRSHRSADAGLGFSGSRGWQSVATWQGRQEATFLSTILSIPGNQSHSLRRRLVALIPRCPECTSSTTHSLMLPSFPGGYPSGMTIRSPRQTSPCRTPSSPHIDM